MLAYFHLVPVSTKHALFEMLNGRRYAVIVDYSSYFEEKLGRWKGFQQKGEVVTLCAGFFQKLQSGYLSREQQDLARGILRFHLDRKINPGKARHVDIRYEEIRSLFPGRVQSFERGSEVRCREPMHFQYSGKGGRNYMFIVDNKNAWN